MSRPVTKTLIKSEWGQAVHDALGAINNVGLRPVQPASYTIFKEGTKYYRCNGLNGKIDDSGTDADAIKNAALDALTDGGDVFCKRATYEIDGLVTVHPKCRLIYEKGAIIKPTSDVDMFKVEENGQLIGGYYDTTGISFSKSVIKLEGDRYYETEPHSTLVYDVQGKGGLGAGKGKFVYIHSEGNNNTIAFVDVDKIYAEGFEYLLHLNADPTALSGWINGNRFNRISGYNFVYGIYLQVIEDYAGDCMVDSNIFKNLQLECGASTDTLLRVTGQGNYFDGELWDVGAKNGIICTEYSKANKFVVLCPKNQIFDLGFKNKFELLDWTDSPIKWFEDDFLGTSLNTHLWTVRNGTIQHIAGLRGICGFTTGGAINDTAYMDWNNIRNYKISYKFGYYVEFMTARATDYRIIIALRGTNDDDRVYVEFSTALGQGGQIGCVSGGTPTTTAFDHTHDTSKHTVFIKTDGSKVAFFVDHVLVGTIATNLTTQFLQPYLYVETLTASALNVNLYKMEMFHL